MTDLLLSLTYITANKAEARDCRNIYFYGEEKVNAKGKVEGKKI